MTTKLQYYKLAENLNEAIQSGIKPRETKRRMIVISSSLCHYEVKSVCLFSPRKKSGRTAKRETILASFRSLDDAIFYAWLLFEGKADAGQFSDIKHLKYEVIFDNVDFENINAQSEKCIWGSSWEVVKTENN